jgi:hypothetical protein
VFTLFVLLVRKLLGPQNPDFYFTDERRNDFTKMSEQLLGEEGCHELSIFIPNPLSNFGVKCDGRISDDLLHEVNGFMRSNKMHGVHVVRDAGEVEWWHICVRKPYVYVYCKRMTPDVPPAAERPVQYFGSNWLFYSETGY